ncbi:Flp family type IVb pilin [Chelativorans alearense]|uniref:Flp family type IVb pilin n=1 Tax=Chelativorans alearense TaxID=2681495 RepID=UPI0013D0CABC|nr:Flp family type IVb pilin [Chelativorans alearense]
MSKLFARFLKDESGATAIEYGLIAALIAIGIITAAGLLGTEISETFDKARTEMEKANGSGG